MQIFPLNTPTEMVSYLTSLIASNMGAIIGVFGLAVGITFVVSFFNKATSTNYWDTDDGRDEIARQKGYRNYKDYEDNV